MSCPQITGIGLITPLGASADETFDALLAGQFITSSSRAKFTDIEGQGSRIEQLTVAAARQAITQSGWTEISADTAIAVGTSKGNIESWIRPGGMGISYGFGLSDLAGYLAVHLNADYAIRATLSAACASGLHACARAVMMLESGDASRALVVGVESSLHPIFQGCFRRLGVLAPPYQPCRPFDKSRHGFHISECAGAICLQMGEAISPFPRIDYFGVAGDAHHLTGVDPQADTLRRLLTAAFGVGPVDLIHAHGTGTVANDAAELSAIEGSLNHSAPLPIVYSHKAALGHCLGASGLVSLVLNCLMHQRGVVPGNVCTVDPLASGLLISSTAVRKPIHRSLSLATGFGGAIGVVGMSSSKA